MKQYIDKIKEFNKSFNIKTEGIYSPPSDFRFELMREENEEYRDAESVTDVIDAITDKLYLLCGDIVHHGLEDKIEEAFSIVHESNMSKLDSEGKPIINGEGGYLDERKPLGKILKSKNFVEPDLNELLNK